jgi:hypothetical protein
MSSTSGKDAGRVPTSEHQDSVTLPQELHKPPFAIESGQGPLLSRLNLGKVPSFRD